MGKPHVKIVIDRHQLRGNDTRRPTKGPKTRNQSWIKASFWYPLVNPVFCVAKLFNRKCGQCPGQNHELFGNYIDTVVADFTFASRFFFLLLHVVVKVLPTFAWFFSIFPLWWLRMEFILLLPHPTFPYYYQVKFDFRSPRFFLSPLPTFTPNSPPDVFFFTPRYRIFFPLNLFFLPVPYIPKLTYIYNIYNHW